MSDIHPSMQRLYAVIAAIDPGKTRQVDVAVALNESSQKVYNWEARGLSKDGALAAQRLLGISATYLLDGLGPEMVSQSQPARISAEMMAAAWRTAGLVAAQTTGSSALAMPRDADLLAQALNAVVEDMGGRHGEGVGEAGPGGQLAGATHARAEGGHARGRGGRAAPGTTKRAGAGAA